MGRAILLVMDSFGLGATKDADKFGDVGANTFGHIAEYCAKLSDQGEREPLSLPNLAKLGLLHAAEESCGAFPSGFVDDIDIIGSYGYARELSTGKDTPSGHWEMAGVPVLFDWGYFTKPQDTFPQNLLNQLILRADLPGILGNCHESGTEIIARLGQEHMTSGKPIVYTSADSVFQIACHEQSFGLDRLLRVCEIARELVDDYNIGRVIARPFVSIEGGFERTGNRRDLAIPPPAPTVLDKLVSDNGEVISIGKIADIFAHQGISKKIKATGNPALFDATLDALSAAPDRSIVFTNFVDFDSAYGHRRDVAGYAQALEYFDTRLPQMQQAMVDDDILLITADHGCDPTWPGSDHTREHIPVLAYGKRFDAQSIGERETFADIGQTMATFFDLEPMEYGTSFLD